MPDRADSISVSEVLEKLIHQKRTIAYTTAAFGILGLVYALVAPDIYEAKALIIPPQQQTSAAAMLSQFGGLAGGAAGALGLKNPTDMYVSMLQSRGVAERILARFGLQREYEIELTSDAVKALSTATEISVGKDGLIQVSFQHKNPEKAAAIANAYVEELDKLTKRLDLSEASQRRSFFEQQMKTVKGSLAQADTTLRLLQEKTGVVQLDTQGRASIQLLADLRAQIAAKEVELGAVRRYATNDKTVVKSLTAEITGLRGQLRSLSQEDSDNILISKNRAPSISSEYIAAMREVKYNESLLELTARQYEVARVDEANEGLGVQIIDPATPPDKRSKPKRALIVLMSLVTGFMIASLLVLARESISRLQR